MLLLRSLLFAVLIPGTVVVLVPRLIAERGGAAVSDAPHVRTAGALLILVGCSIMTRCIWDFARKGRGTLAPVDPPRSLVVHGLYRYVRNPMYLGALMALVGQALLFESKAISVYTIVWLVWVHLFIVFYEEPALERQFGDSYKQYCAAVHRWAPVSKVRYRRRTHEGVQPVAETEADAREDYSPRSSGRP